MMEELNKVCLEEKKYIIKYLVLGKGGNPPNVINCSSGMFFF